MLWQFLRRWLPLAVLATVLAGTLYTVGQQILRSDANDPQVQLAEDAAARLQGGAAPSGVVPLDEVDVGASLAPWLIVYDARRQPVAGSARLHGKLPDYPTSAFDHAPPGGRDAITWQPEPGVRSATVIVGFKGGWVVSGRSLRLVEEREDLLLQLALLGWLAALGATALVVVAVRQ